MIKVKVVEKINEVESIMEDKETLVITIIIAKILDINKNIIGTYVDIQDDLQD